MIGYLLASSPTPRLGEPPGATVAAFLEGCRGFLSEAAGRDLAAVVGATGDPWGVRHPTARAWLDLAAQVDDAVVRARAARAQRDPTPQLGPASGFRVDVVAGVAAAFERPHPAARERALDELRWRLADEWTAADPDGFGALLARAVQLSLASRWAAWAPEAGWIAFEDALRQLEAGHG